MSHDRRAAALTRTTWCAAWAAVVWITAAVAHLTDTQGVWFLAGLPFALILAVVDVNMGLAKDTRGAYVAWRAILVAAWSVWTAAGTGYTPWDSTVAAVWLVLLVVSIGVIPWVATPTKPGENLLGQVWGGRETEWRDRIMRLCKISVATCDVTKWPSRVGWRIIGEFGEGGATWEDLAARANRFASDLKLPDGCAVEISMGAHQGAYEINYSTVNAFAVSDDEDNDFTAMPEPQPGSINDPCPCGYFADASTAEITDLRQESILVGGANSAGKSTAMEVITCWHVTRIDQLTYVIDLTGGRLGRPFIEPYLGGVTDRPAIDGLADTPERAEALLTWLIDVIEDRPVTYRQAIIDADDNKLPVSAAIPAIRLVIDEPKKIWANPRLAPLAGKLVELQETGRAMAVRPDYTALGGTLSSLPGDLKKQVRHRIALRCADIAEVAYLLDWVAARVLNIRSLARKGMAYIGAFDGPAPRLMRFWRAKPSLIRKVAITAAGIRPGLDEAAKRLPSYAAVADRWNWQHQTTPAPEPKEPTMDTPTPKPSGLEAALTEFKAAEANMVDVFTRLKAHNAQREAAQQAGGVVVATRPDIATAVKTYLAERGETETATADIVEHLKEQGHRQTDNRLREIIKELADAGKITRPRHGFYLP